MPHVLSGDYTPLSAVDIFVKDLGLVLDTARASKFPLPLAAAAHQMFCDGLERRPRPRGRRGGDQDLSRYKAASEILTATRSCYAQKRGTEHHRR